MQSRIKSHKNCQQIFNWTHFFHISPYNIFAGYLRRTPDMQAETGQPIYFWNRLLKAVVLQKTDFDFMHNLSRTKQKSAKLTEIHCIAAVSQFFRLLKNYGVIFTNLCTFEKYTGNYIASVLTLLVYTVSFFNLSTYLFMTGHFKIPGATPGCSSSSTKISINSFLISGCP